jgi:hypothetical protein
MSRVDEQILTVARSIRWYLPRLLGAQAAQYDRSLVELLRQAASGADVGPALLDLLSRPPTVHSWAASALADQQLRPPDVQQAGKGPASRGFSPLPNRYGTDIIDAERYVCPKDGNFVWWRIRISDPIPKCQDHPDTTLVLA